MADLGVTLTDQPLGVSRLELGLSLISVPQLWAGAGAAGWPEAVAALRPVLGALNTHLLGWGPGDPWPDPASPEPDNWRTFDATLARMHELAPDASKIVTLWGGPWWMRGELQPDGTTRLLTPADGSFSPKGRILTGRLPHWRRLVTAAVRRSLAEPYRVRHFQVWNEFKGFYTNPAALWTRWDDDADEGTPGDHADMGYSALYRHTVEAILEAARQDGVSADEVQIGGPYVVFPTRGRPAHASVPPGHPLRQRAWGTADRTATDALTQFLTHVRERSLKLDFVAVDLSTATRDDVYPSADDWALLEKFSDVTRWVQGEMARLGFGNLPLVYSEAYAAPSPVHQTAGQTALRVALKAEMLRRLCEAGVRTVLAWGAYGEGEGDHAGDGGLITPTSAADGGQPLPWRDAALLFRRHFAPGTRLYRAEVSGPGLSVLAGGTGVLLINRTPAPCTVMVNGAGHTVAPYQVTVVAR